MPHRQRFWMRFDVWMRKTRKISKVYQLNGVFLDGFFFTKQSFGGVVLWLWSGSAIIGICKDGARKQRLVIPSKIYIQYLFYESNMNKYDQISNNQSLSLSMSISINFWHSFTCFRCFHMFPYVSHVFRFPIPQLHNWDLHVCSRDWRVASWCVEPWRPQRHEDFDDIDVFDRFLGELWIHSSDFLERFEILVECVMNCDELWWCVCDFRQVQAQLLQQKSGVLEPNFWIECNVYLCDESGLWCIVWLKLRTKRIRLL